MALSADLNVDFTVVDRVMTVKAGGADTLYKGAILNLGTDGYAKIAADTTLEFPAGINKKQVVAAGSNAEDVEILVGCAWLAHSGAAATDVGAVFYATADDTLADSGTVMPLGTCIGWKAGYLLIDMLQKTDVT